jgi:uncharacterized protein (TIGR03437 family)
MTYCRLFSSLIFAALAASAEPRIAPDGVLNGASYAPAGFLNSGIAQGSLFVILGDDLGPAELQIAGAALPTSLGGVSVTVSAADGTHAAYLYYVSSHAIAALLPSGTPLGQATVTVTYQGQTGKPANIVVARRKVGIFTLNEAGSGPAVAQNFNSATDQPLNTLITPAAPGQLVTLWATGLGAVSGDEAAAPQVGDLGPISVYVGGKRAVVRYAGRSGCCVGVDQINFEVPLGVEGCYVPVIAVTGSFNVQNLIRNVPMDGPSSNFATISIGSQGVCSDPTGLTGAELQRLQTAGAAKLGVLQFDGNAQGLGVDALAARFSRADLLTFLRSRGIFGLPVPGSCIAYASGPDPVRFAPLDAGPTLTVTGPGGSRQLVRDADGSYAAPQSSASLVPGTYTVDNGSGGVDVGGFRATFNIPPAVQWLNPNLSGSNVSPTLNWSGGDANGYVIITSVAQNNLARSTTVCVEATGAGSFQVPSYAYALNGADGVFGPSPNTVAIGSAAPPVRFTAPGLDEGFIFATLFSAGTFIR